MKTPILITLTALDAALVGYDLLWILMILSVVLPA
jgi:hypothetical protein